MKWVEMIRVRSTPGRLDVVLPRLVGALAELPCENQLLRHGIYEGDLAALLLWNEGTPAPTREGMMLAEQMQAHGSIDHAVWIPTGAQQED